MIKQSSIDEVKQRTDLKELVSRYTEVKKDVACCPFHQEKSPSFRIWQSKQIYKCFGCGEGGDAFKLIMKLEKLNFVEAIEWLAKHYNITLEYDQQSQQEAQDVKDKRTEMQQATEIAFQLYKNSIGQLPADSTAIQYLQKRGYTKEKIESWDIGYAPDSWDYIKTTLINKGLYNAAVECGLIYSKEGKNFDFYRNRLIIPLHDMNGNLVGLAGRWVPTGNEAEDKKQPKYLNPPESLLYNKKKVWYGLWQAQKAIRTYGFVYIVEGYMDVQSMHEANIINTIAACGTEIDMLQVKFLKRYADHVVLAFDGDSAGINKMMKSKSEKPALIDTCLKHDFKTMVLNLPDGMDPDEYIRSIDQRLN